MKRLYIVRYFVEAESMKAALKVHKTMEPTEIYLSEDWMTKVGFVSPLVPPDKQIEGFRNK